ncbi:hypothetical protein SAMN04487781_3196 [Cellulosimicrobium cellulans]|nr:hypothetical protein SAMN04487781_3196 [Cellulosimicrobium cellulans]
MSETPAQPAQPTRPPRPLARIYPRHGDGSPVFDVAQDILEPALAATRRDLERTREDISEHQGVVAAARKHVDYLLESERQILAALAALGSPRAEDDR